MNFSRILSSNFSGTKKERKYEQNPSNRVEVFLDENELMAVNGNNCNGTNYDIGSYHDGTILEMQSLNGHDGQQQQQQQMVLLIQGRNHGDGSSFVNGQMNGNVQEANCGNVGSDGGSGQDGNVPLLFNGSIPERMTFINDHTSSVAVGSGSNAMFLPSSDPESGKRYLDTSWNGGRNVLEHVLEQELSSQDGFVSRTQDVYSTLIQNQMMAEENGAIYNYHLPMMVQTMAGVDNYHCNSFSSPSTDDGANTISSSGGGHVTVLVQQQQSLLPANNGMIFDHSPSFVTSASSGNNHHVLVPFASSSSLSSNNSSRTISSCSARHLTPNPSLGAPSFNNHHQFVPSFATIGSQDGRGSEGQEVFMIGHESDPVPGFMLPQSMSCQGGGGQMVDQILKRDSCQKEQLFGEILLYLEHCS